MIEKLESQDKYSAAGFVLAMAGKINELVDAVNILQCKNVHIESNLQDLMYPKEIKCEPAENGKSSKMEQDPAGVATTLIKTLRMDKEFAEAECVRLQGKLETTQNALEVALAALNTIKPKKDLSQGGFWTLSQSAILDVVLRAEKEIKRITKGGDNE